MPGTVSLQSAIAALPEPLPARVVGAVDAIIAAAEAAGASDVHLQPGPVELQIRFRLDGVLLPIATLPMSLTANIVARFKVLAELLTYRLDIPQEGSVRRGDHLPALRVSTFPTVHGEKVVVRFFAAAGRLSTLEALGLSGPQQSALRRILAERTGAILFTGPSGSGKTTTAYACLRSILSASPGRNLVSIEDPVECLVPGVSQSQIRPGSDFDFPRGLRSILRQDPDVLLVGEVRDPGTAAIASEASLTGHLVLSTLHSGSCCGAVSRLLEMGVEPYLLTSGLRAVVNQRLLRQACGDCQGNGCSACLGTGYRGRLLVAELLEPDAGFRRAILARGDLETLNAAAGERTRLKVVAEEAVSQGRTTHEEVARVLGSDS